MARKNVVADTDVLKLKDRPPGFECPRAQHVTFPGGFRAAFSIEQQPPGLCSHLSISVFGRPKKGAMPHPAAVEMIAREFGVPCPADKMWMEKFEPGEFAINLLSLHAPTKERDRLMADRAFLERLSRELAEQGKLIEAGWVGYRIVVIAPDAPSIQLDECKLAFFAGAQHLFASLMSIMDPGAEPTDADEKKMEMIDKELRKFGREFELKVVKTKGSA